jgi:dGTPase
MHDVEDGLAAGIFREEELREASALWRGAREQVDLRHPGFLDASADQRLRVKRVANEMLKICINDLIHASAERLAAAKLTCADDARAHRTMLIGHSKELKKEVAELERFLDKRFYKHPHLQELTRHAATTLRELFHAYLARPQEMAPWYRQWADKVTLPRAVCDYLAGMTDRFAEHEATRLRQLD